MPAAAELNPASAEAVARLWRFDAGVAAAAARARAQLALPDCAAHFLDRAEALAAPDCVPTVDDVLRARVRTSGVVEETLCVAGTAVTVIDVGGQRGERRGWLPAFGGVTAVIFVAALSEYDQPLAEDAGVNRVAEAVELFAEVCNAPWFAAAAMVLFLNKCDLFVDKLAAGVDLRDDGAPPRFLDYTGGCGNPRAALAYLTERFHEHNRRADAHALKTHVTCATDTTAMRVVFDAITDSVLRTHLAADVDV
jgi:hypothetical protein